MSCVVEWSIWDRPFHRQLTAFTELWTTLLPLQMTQRNILIKEFARKILSKLLPNVALVGVVEGGIGDTSGQLTAENMYTEATGTIMTVVDWVYFAYQVANLVIQKDYETVNKHDTKNCLQSILHSHGNPEMRLKQSEFCSNDTEILFLPCLIPEFQHTRDKYSSA